MFSEDEVKKIAITIYQNLKRGNDFDGLITEAIKLNTKRHNSEIIGCEVVVEEKTFAGAGCMLIQKVPKTYLNKDGKTCIEVKQFNYGGK